MYHRTVKGKTYYFYAKMVGGIRNELSLGPDRDAAIVKLASRLRDTDETWAKELRGLFSRTKKRAQSRSIPFSLTFEDVNQMFFQSDKRCTISGIAYSSETVDGKRFRPWMPSLDRVDPHGPYSRENCRLVCAYINIAINQFGEDQLLKVVGRIARRRRS